MRHKRRNMNGELVGLRGSALWLLSNLPLGPRALLTAPLHELLQAQRRYPNSVETEPARLDFAQQQQPMCPF